MQRIVEYVIMFIVTILLQVFVFSRLGISVYVNPLIYIACIILLPMEIAGALLLVIAFLLGVTIDFLMGMAGINTVATLFAAFCRPTILTYLVGKDEVKDGGVPNVNSIGRKKFLRYAGVMIFLHSSAFFILESLSWDYFYYVVLRIICSGLLCLVIVYFVQKFFSVNRNRFQNNI